MALRIVSGSGQAPLEPLLGRTVAILGYGNQGRAHALNLRDSGIDVIVGGRGATGPHSDRPPAIDRARHEGFRTMSIAAAAAAGDLLVVALPDEVQGQVFAAEIAPALRRGCTVGFLHGFAIRFGAVRPPSDVGVVMVAPKGPGEALRSRYSQGQGLLCLLAVNQDPPGCDAERRALAWASAIGCARAGIIYTTFADEAETDLFGEQAVLCGGLGALILAAFETLVAAGYPPELAYLECCHEVKQIADLVYERGLAATMGAISNTAEFGAYEAGGKLVDEETRRRLAAMLGEIRSGAFARRLREDHARGFPWFQGERKRLLGHAIEPAGKVIRALARTQAAPDGAGRAG